MRIKRRLSSNKPGRGTKIDFVLSLKSKSTLLSLFNQYTDESFQLSKTGIRVKLYHQEIDDVSRSQARRILAGLEKFKTIELDFKGVKTAGQGFADEIFRVWQKAHKEIKPASSNADENIVFMIRRAQHSLTAGLQLLSWNVVKTVNNAEMECQYD